MSFRPNIARKIKPRGNPIIFQQIDENNQTDDFIVNEMIYNMKTVMTKFVTQNFFSHVSGPCEFLSYVIDTYNKSIAEYIDEYNLLHVPHIDRSEIVFMYKGGNTVRMLLLQYLSHLSPDITENIIADYGKYLNRSDADFQILINPNHPDYENIFTDLGYLSYNVLEHIKREFENTINTDKYFIYPILPSAVKKRILEQYFGDLEEVIIDSNKKGGPLYKIDYLICGDTIAVSPIPRIALSEFPIGEKDVPIDAWSVVDNPRFHSFVFKFNPKSPTSRRRNLLITPVQEHTHVYVLGRQNRSIFYNSLNTSILYPSERDKNLITQFTLARMKISVMAIFTSTTDTKKCGYISVPGELIDVAIPHRKSYELQRLITQGHENLIPSHITTYRFRDNQYSFQFNTYSNKALLENLEKMLFIEHLRPWSDRKYEKHLTRYILLVFFMSLENNRLSTLSAYMSQFIKKLTLQNDLEIEYQIPEFISFWKFHNELMSLIRTSDDKNDFVSYSKYLVILSQLISLFIKICQSIDTSQLINGIIYINTQQLTQIGGNNRKYTKYRRNQCRSKYNAKKC